MRDVSRVVAANKARADEPETRQHKRAFYNQRDMAKIRGIEWCFTFEQWLKIWQDSGHLHERGRLKGQYVMARYGDAGPYSVDNVRIVLGGTNLDERDTRKWSGTNNSNVKLTEEIVRDIRATHLIETHEETAQRLGLSYETVRDVRRLRTWKWLDPDQIIDAADLEVAAKRKMSASGSKGALAQRSQMTPEQLLEMCSNGGKKAHEAKDADGKSILAKRMGAASTAATTMESRRDWGRAGARIANHSSEQARENHRRAALAREAKKRLANSLTI